MFEPANFAKVREAVMAYPEATIAIFLGGLFIGWGAAWLIARRELTVNRLIIEHAKDPKLSSTDKNEILNKALPQRKWDRLKPVLVPVFVVIIAIFAMWFVLPQMVQPSTWQFTAAQQTSLKSALQHEKDKFRIVLIPVAGSPAATAFAYKLMPIVGSDRPVSLVPYDPYNPPSKTGLEIAMKMGGEADKNAKAAALKNILETVMGIKVRFSHHPGLPEGNIALIIGAPP
jgi:hypothetical protein